eukprot:CAMPEP_0113301912 /NCGR_PEP_ID=MMETSP0010_2-20120614/2938_1 /TAXON_ID=216773 ORGANISM="Corethron hystrix, Strain 308" /NCGR_SAMPLE_ID=MMETSP0010_2 /ASSEMBLY_ACC=CAM_ASM_000155 /LENGTH=204 /DNA_ID=CAMNT_0000155603 /DNA_START=138 /DNA_END=749 /DNA_ORIENTATION=- /assembly_acc=CAM_ASM_000155
MAKASVSAQDSPSLDVDVIQLYVTPFVSSSTGSSYAFHAPRHFPADRDALRPMTVPLSNVIQCPRGGDSIDRSDRSEAKSENLVDNLKETSQLLETVTAFISTNHLSKLAEYIGKTAFRSYFVLLMAITIEIFATAMLKIGSDTNSTSKVIISMAMYLTSFLSFGATLKQIDVGVAYAIWSAMGTAIVTTFGVAFFGELCDAKK